MYSPVSWGLLGYNVHPPPTAAKFPQRLRDLVITPINVTHIMYEKGHRNLQKCESDISSVIMFLNL